MKGENDNVPHASQSHRKAFNEKVSLSKAEAETEASIENLSITKTELAT
jgi:hypothetical protein